MSDTREFDPGDIAVLKSASIAKSPEYTIVSGPTGPSKFYQVSTADGKTDLIPERDLLHKPQQADRLTPVQWRDCDWIPKELRS